MKPHILPHAAGPLAGAFIAPGDKSISHRAVLLALLADGPCRATGWLDCADTQSSLAAARALGAAVAQAGDEVSVAPAAQLPAGPVLVDCGNSGTTARLLMGVLAGLLPAGGAAVTLTGDASLRRRPMARVVDPLRRMGADLSYADQDGRLPVVVKGARLCGVDHELAVASAQVASALLLAGLGADGRTLVRGAAGARDHTERLLRGLGVPVDVDAIGAAVTGPRRLPAFTLAVPGDPSSAAFFQVAAALVPGSRVASRGQSLNPTRTGALRVLGRAGAIVTCEPAGKAREGEQGEPRGDVVVAAGDRRAFTIEGGEMPSLVDEIPVLAVLATQCAGRSVISGAGELRVKESDRLALLARNLRRLGASIDERPDGLVIDGPTPLRGGSMVAPMILETAGDHRIAMAMAVATLCANGETALDDEACVGVSFPGFFDVMDRLLAGGDPTRP